MKKHTNKYRVLIAYNLPQQPAEQEELDFISEQAVQEEARAVYEALVRRGHEPFYRAIQNLEEDLRKIQQLKPDVIFNLCEGFRGNAHLEMHMAALWELTGIPYTGNRPLTLGVAQDKILTKRLLESYKISTPPYQVFTQASGNTYLEFPLIAKPSREDASVGITQDSIIYSIKDLKEVVSRLLKKYHQPILVEKFIKGREFNVSILGNGPSRVLPISEIQFEKVEENYAPITSYEAKWLKNHPLYQQTPSVCPADIPPDLRSRVEDTALRVYHLLRGRAYGRVDIRVDHKDRMFVLEFNPNPDISPDAGFARAIAAAHIRYEDFVEFLVNQAIAGHSHDFYPATSAH